MSNLMVQDVPKTAQTDQEALRGWGILLPGPAELGLDSDSVDQLERYLYGEESTVQDWVDHCLPWAARQ
jgi:hypothetical protein